MSKEEILERLAQSVVDLNKNGSQQIAQEAIDTKVPPVEAIAQGLSMGLKRIGEMWNEMEIFLPEVMAAVQCYYAGLEILKPHITEEGTQPEYIGTAVFGTIFGDIHTVGKDVVIPVFQGEDYNVIDLGVDVAPEKYVEAIQKYNPDIVGLGTYMSETFLSVPVVIEALEKAGVRDKVMVLCGGPAADDKAAKRMGADAAFRDAWEAVSWTKQALAERR